MVRDFCHCNRMLCHRQMCHIWSCPEIPRGCRLQAGLATQMVFTSKAWCPKYNISSILQKIMFVNQSAPRKSLILILCYANLIKQLDFRASSEERVLCCLHYF